MLEYWNIASAKRRNGHRTGSFLSGQMTQTARIDRIIPAFQYFSMWHSAICLMAVLCAICLTSVAAADNGEDEADPMLASGALSLWTENQRRVINNQLLPGAATLPAGDWYYRISHVARESYDEDIRTNLAGMDDNVKIGFMVGYAPVKATTLTLNRINGRDLAVEPVDGEAVSYDTWELTGKVQLLDQRGVRGLRHGPCDLAVLVGGSAMVRNHGGSDYSLNLGLIAERDLCDDRLRLGTGIVRAGLSAFDGAVGSGPGDKLFPDEVAYQQSQGVNAVASNDSTTAIPVTARIAVAKKWFLLGEAAIPVAGYDTGKGPSYSAGVAFDTNTHEFSLLFTNTPNAAFNSVITGGTQRTQLPYIAFAITAYL
jgi:hypothetical protein